MSTARDYRVMVSIGELVAGEDVTIDPDQWPDEIEHGWLVPVEALPVDPREMAVEALRSPASTSESKDARSMPVSLYRATLSFGPFRAGEYVQIDPRDWGAEIEAGLLVEHVLPVEAPPSERVDRMTPASETDAEVHELLTERVDPGDGSDEKPEKAKPWKSTR